MFDAQLLDQSKIISEPWHSGSNGYLPKNRRTEDLNKRERERKLKITPRHNINKDRAM